LFAVHAVSPVSLICLGVLGRGIILPRGSIVSG
jgi:hypothetical protein